MKQPSYKISLKAHLTNLLLLSLFGIIVSYLLRFVFLVWSLPELSNKGRSTLAFILGGVFDISMIIYALIPFMLLPFLLPSSKTQENAQKRYRRVFSFFLTSFLLIAFLVSIAEVVFWNEFHTRFNFIAVDYLVYTHEVLQNIWESYPIFWIILGILVATVFISKRFISFLKTKVVESVSLKKQLLYFLGIITVLSLNTLSAPTKVLFILNDFKLEEISKNGVYSLFQAYFENQIDYEKLYARLDREEAFLELRKNLSSNNSDFSSDYKDIGRLIKREGPLENYNVILVAMESLSARFTANFGDKQGLTPNLNRLANESLYFTNVFATGTRTVRGLEALTLSVPPTPGQSILRRPKNENLNTLQSYFKNAAYTTEFIYGGYSYFDNMNSFFVNNDMKVWDRANIDKSKVTFSNAWGVCDENLYDLAIERADESFKAGKNFFQLVLTTSNHRPYTYPQKIDIPSGTGRDGAVKYSDFAIGEFIKNSRSKKWFKDTIFIFVADHNASVSGKTELPVYDFRIPFMIYAPEIIKPQVVTKLGSQIDLAPTVLELLNFSYKSNFFGRSLLDTQAPERAFISTYQSVALLKNKTLTVLSPNQKVLQYNVLPDDGVEAIHDLNKDLVRETISYYQTAYVLFSEGLMKAPPENRVFNLENVLSR